MHSCSGLQTLTLKVSVSLHVCRILHLAIIHEEESIAQQLIQLFPKTVLDIQNNLYQVSAMGPLPRAASAGIFSFFFFNGDFLSLVRGNAAIVFFFFLASGRF